MLQLIQHLALSFAASVHTPFHAYSYTDTQSSPLNANIILLGEILHGRAVCISYSDSPLSVHPLFHEMRLSTLLVIAFPHRTPCCFPENNAISPGVKSRSSGVEVSQTENRLLWKEENRPSRPLPLRAALLLQPREKFLPFVGRKSPMRTESADETRRLTRFVDSRTLEPRHAIREFFNSVRVFDV